LSIAKEILEMAGMDNHYVLFGFQGQENLREYHVTHLFMGETYGNDVRKVVGVIDSYVKEKQPKQFNASFKEEKFFGENLDVRVLLPENKDLFLPDLREKLESFSASKYPYSPHLTTKLEKYENVVDRIVLSKEGYNPLKIWNLKK
jgi:2'-5' RNA ligase